jgi:hypothetical protein
MEKRSILSWLERMDVKLFFGLLFLYQLIFIFQGFDMADEGFHATFYDRFYSDPESVEYNFMFWLSGVFGNLFSGFGLWGIRLGGVLVIMATIIATYQLLKRYLNPGYLKLGLFLVTILLNNNRKTIYYDNLSILFYVLIILFLIAGLRDRKLWKFFVSGLFIAACVFTRPPNITVLGLGVVILYYAFLYKVSWKVWLMQAFIWGVGFFIGSVALLGLMKVMGHYTYFVNALGLIFSMGADEGNQNYGALNLIKNYYPPYTTGVIQTIIVLGLVIIAVVVPGFVKAKSVVLDIIKWGFTLIVLAVVGYMILKDKEDNVLPLYLFTGLTILTAVIVLFFSKLNNNIKVLMLAGCYMVAVYPFGSSSGMYTVGINTFWIAFPIVIDYWFNRQTLGRQPFIINTEQVKWIRSFAVLLLVFACLLHAYFYPYFDKRNRMKMTHSIDNSRLKGIFTSEERATSFNQLLAESEKYVKPNDYVLAYDCMPMYHYVTRTRPYIKNSWPYLYSARTFSQELMFAKAHTKVLPVVVMQTIKTIGSGSDWPTEPLTYDIEWLERNKKRNEYLQQFLNENGYKEVWNNGVFKIFTANK